ncbi:MAG: hypothetical protein JXL20_00860 [Deltaproteobacteria bacterium]|nr:hypothetical protein [Deltaproteobacteria bacterium]
MSQVKMPGQTVKRLSAVNRPLFDPGSSNLMQPNEIDLKLFVSSRCRKLFERKGEIAVWRRQAAEILLTGPKILRTL